MRGTALLGVCGLNVRKCRADSCLLGVGQAMLQAGLIVAGWDARDGGSVFGVPLGGTLVKVPFTIGAAPCLPDNACGARAPPFTASWAPCLQTRAMVRRSAGRLVSAAPLHHGRKHGQSAT